MGNYFSNTLSNTSSNTSSMKVSLTDSVRSPDTMPSGEARVPNTYTDTVCRPCTKTPEEVHYLGCDRIRCSCLMQC